MNDMVIQHHDPHHHKRHDSSDAVAAVDTTATTTTAATTTTTINTGSNPTSSNSSTSAASRKRSTAAVKTRSPTTTTTRPVAVASKTKLNFFFFLMGIGIMCIATFFHHFNFYSKNNLMVIPSIYYHNVVPAATNHDTSNITTSSTVENCEGDFLSCSSSLSSSKERKRDDELKSQLLTKEEDAAAAVEPRPKGRESVIRRVGTNNDNTNAELDDTMEGRRPPRTTKDNQNAATGGADARITSIMANASSTAVNTLLSSSFDSCRNITWNEITIQLIHEQDIIISKKKNDNDTLDKKHGIKKMDIGGASGSSNTTSNNSSSSARTSATAIMKKDDAGLLLRKDVFQAQTDAIMAQVKPYFQLMESESPHNRTILILPKALHIYSKHVQQHDEDHENDITMATQMGVGKYTRFLVLVQRWNGPVSVAVMIHSLEDLEQFHTFVSLNLATLKNVLFHYYIEYAPELATAYPQNILRNLALKYMETEFFIVNDVDIFPSPIDSHDTMKVKVLTQHPEIRSKLRNDTFFVIPMFDLDVMIQEDELTYDHVHFPNSKQDAIRMIQNGMLHQHLGKSHPRGHGAVNYTKWLKNNNFTRSSAPQEEDEVSYPIQYDFFFEPYVLGSRSIRHNNGTVPSYFEMYRGFGFDKFSWYSELEFAGFKLEVLQNFFMFHAKHEVSYGDKGSDRHKHFKTNQACSRIFLEGILDKYGEAQKKKSMWNEWLSFCRIKRW
jgi:hypothetical protein